MSSKTVHLMDDVMSAESDSPLANSIKSERSGRSVCIQWLRAEYSASRVGYNQMVRGRIIRSAPQHEGTHWRSNVVGKRVGSAYSTSTKQKLVAQSSTESEVIGVHDVSPQAIWTTYFLKDQGVKVEQSVLFQDNMSSILLEKNGRSSSSKQTRHMNIRFLFIKDRVDSREVRIEHCPTGDMIAHFFTKPLQGRQFYKLRDQVMNIDLTSTYHSNHRSVLKLDDDDSREKLPGQNKTNGCEEASWLDGEGETNRQAK